MREKDLKSIFSLVFKKQLILFVLLISFLSLQLLSTCTQGVGKLSIYVSAMDDPCKVDNTRTWYVTIYNCDGTVLEWCGKRYVVIPTKCGYLEVKVPPGCYYLKAVWGFHLIGHGVYWVNHYTDAAIVQACCGKTTCVRLFNPSAHRCGIIYALAINDMIRMKAIKPQTGERAIKAINDTLKQIPIPIKKFELGHEEEIIKLLEKQKEEK